MMVLAACSSDDVTAGRDTAARDDDDQTGQSGTGDASASGSSSPSSPSPSPEPPEWAAAELDATGEVVAVGGAPSSWPVTSAPVVVRADLTSPRSRDVAAWLGANLQAPVLAAQGLPPAEWGTTVLVEVVDEAPAPDPTPSAAPTSSSTPSAAPTSSSTPSAGAATPSAGTATPSAGTATPSAGTATPSAVPTPGGPATPSPSGSPSPSETGSPPALLADIEVLEVVIPAPAEPSPSPSGSEGASEPDASPTTSASSPAPSSSPTPPASASPSAPDGGSVDPGPPLAVLAELAGAGDPPHGALLDEVEPVLDQAEAAGSGGPLALLRPDADAGATGVALTALALGGYLAPLDGPDPRGDATTRAVLQDAPTTSGVWLAGGGGPWGEVPRDDLPWLLDVAANGPELPGGMGQLLFDDHRLVALYGNPNGGALGVLGEQPLPAAIDRAEGLAGDYEGLDDLAPVPAFEIIATVAAGSPSDDGDYSYETERPLLEEWVRGAGEAGVYVLLDLQPGRTSFLTQAQLYEDLLRLPYVGLALDPEWRLKPDEVHLRQIGSVSIEEVNATGDWLAELTREELLPEKMFLLHQFRLSMIRDRERLQEWPELATVIQMDGQGGQNVKQETWDALTRDPPADARYGWKNFYDEDPTVLSPSGTVGKDPTPVFVSYQ